MNDIAKLSFGHMMLRIGEPSVENVPRAGVILPSVACMLTHPQRHMPGAVVLMCRNASSADNGVRESERHGGTSDLFHHFDVKTRAL